MKHNKRKMIEAIECIMLIVAVFILAPGFAGYIDTHYKMDCVVTRVESDGIEVEDPTGNLWFFYGDGFTEGENVRVTFFDNATSNNRFDDEIQKVEKKS